MVITVIAFWQRLGHLLREGPHWTGYEEVEEMRGEEAAGATSDLPPSQNSRPKAAGGCQATLSLSQQEAESHKKNINHSQQRRLTKSPSAAQAAAGRPFPVAPVGSIYLPAITLPAAWDRRCRPSAGRCVCTTNEKTFLRLFYFWAAVCGQHIWTVWELFFLNIIFMRGKTFVGCVLGEFIWLQISLKTNPEGCPPPAQPAFNLFLSPAKACPFKVPAASSAARSLQVSRSWNQKDQIGLNLKCLRNN